ncbi:MAG TPA: hypothetical protein VFA43_16295, partial [Gemmatimonadaceae bacterium]|nr:hypothetical protein [Gemmatimonadaceae bacterium]
GCTRRPRPWPSSSSESGKTIDPYDDVRDRRDDLRDDLRDVLRFGTFAPFFRASLSPIAIACLRLFTVPPLPPRPDLSVPRFRRRIALATRFDAAFPYLRAIDTSWSRSM